MSTATTVASGSKASASSPTKAVDRLEPNEITRSERPMISPG